MNIENRVSNNGITSITGWAFIDDGISTAGSEIYLLVNDGEDEKLLRTTKVSRPDVTKYFHNGICYNDSGFNIVAKCIKDHIEMKIIIIRDDTISAASITI